MITVELTITDGNGQTLFRDIYDEMPCHRYEVEIETSEVANVILLPLKFTARVTEWERVDETWVPKDPPQSSG